MVNGRIAQRDAGAPSSPPTASCSSGCWACDRRRRRGSRGAADRRATSRRPTAGLHGAPRPWRRRAVARRHRAEHGARLHALERRRHRGAGGRHRARTAARRAAAIALRSRALDAQPSLPRPSASMPVGAGVRLPGRREHRPRRLCRRHLRHQGPRAHLHAPLPGEARPAHRHRRSLDLRQAVARRSCIRARWRATIPQGEAAVFSGDRGARSPPWPRPSSASSRTRRDIGGMISAGGSGGTALATPACARCRSACPR